MITNPPTVQVNRQKENDKNVLLEERFCPNPFYYHLIKLDLAIFGSLTWKSELARRPDAIGARIRKADFNKLIRRTCGYLAIDRDAIGFYFKSESSSSQLGHSHFLIASDGIGSRDKFINALKIIWRTMGVADTPSHIVAFDDHQREACISYVCKKDNGRFGNVADTDDLCSNVLNNLIKEEQFWERESTVDELTGI